MHRSFVPAALAALCLLTVATVAPAIAGEPVVELERRVSMFDGDDDTATLVVYADGRFEVHRPAFRRDAGDWTGSLTSSELRALVTELRSAGLQSWDDQRIAAARRAEDSARRARAAAGQPVVVHGVTDADVVTLTLAARDGSGPRTIRYQGLRNDRRAYPEIAEIAALASVVDELDALIEREDLEVAR